MESVAERPPGVIVDKGTHGPQAQPPLVHRGVGHLREVMRLTQNVPVAELCEEAALEIKSLREGLPERPATESPRVQSQKAKRFPKGGKSSRVPDVIG